MIISKEIVFARFNFVFESTKAVLMSQSTQVTYC